MSMSFALLFFFLMKLIRFIFSFLDRAKQIRLFIYLPREKIVDFNFLPRKIYMNYIQELDGLIKLSSC